MSASTFQIHLSRKKLGKIGKFYDQGSAPYPYYTRKFKDLSRKRGIVSYFAHPLKFVYSINAKAFLVVLKSVKFFHSNLFNPTQAVLHMKFLYMFLRDAYGANTEFMSWAADVKEMYDSLPQEDMIKAITWILKTVQKSSRRDFVCVNLKRQEETSPGKRIQS